MGTLMAMVTAAAAAAAAAAVTTAARKYQQRSTDLNLRNKTRMATQSSDPAISIVSSAATTAAAALTAAMTCTNLQYSFLGTSASAVAVTAIAQAAGAPVAVDSAQGSSIDAEADSPAALVEEVIEAIRAAFISERDPSRSKGPLSDSELGHIVATALAEVTPVPLPNEVVEKAIALQDYSSLRTYIPSVSDAHRAIRTLLKELHDPYCRFLEPEVFATLGKYDISGVGLNLGVADDTDRQPIVIGLFLNGAAQKAGIERGDKIVAIDDQNVQSLTPFEVSTILQDKCKAGAEAIKVDVFHQNADGVSESVTIHPPKLSQSGTIPIPLSLPSFLSNKSVSVNVEMEGEKRVAVIRIREMTADTVADVAKAIKDVVEPRNREKTKLGNLSSGDQMDAFVIDLRSNRGGLVSAGIETAGLFLEKGSVIVVTETSKNKDGSPGFFDSGLNDAFGKGIAAGVKRETTAARSTQLTSAPLMLLVDGSTASAAEILAAALQDNCRAIVVGQKTFGKGLIQSVFELSDGSAIVLTVGNYLTPKMTNIDSQGIRPDIDRYGPFWTRPSFEEAKDVLDACERP